MGKTLVIAEKPSVAKAIAGAMGGGRPNDGFIESDKYVFSWCLGHLVGLADGAAYDPKYEKWRMEDLPLLPEKWKYVVLKSSRAQYSVLKKLLARADIDEVVNACDAGREGELIFRLVYRQAKCRKPMKRLWISSMEESAIRQGMANLAPGEDYDNLFRAAECRHKADWAVGINATRLFTSKYGRLIRVGRVVAPTLAIVVNRQKEIDDFHPLDYWKVVMDLGGSKAKTERIDDKDRAEALAEFCRTGSAVVTDVTEKERKVSPPKLFDLTGLQREANKLFGFTAAHTLELAQKLYEAKLITYPRTDSAYLTDDMSETAKKTLTMIEGTWPHLSGGGHDIPRLLNSKKVSDHYAIIPTMQAGRTDLSVLSEDERRLLELVASRLAAASAEPRICLDTKVTVEVRNGDETAPELFTVRGSQTVSAGWKAVEDAAKSSLKAMPQVDEEESDDEDAEAEAEIPKFAAGQSFLHPPTEVTTHKTKPPAQFTEASLLASMEKAGASEVTEDAERKGLGTPATRADVIERLVRDGMLVRKARKLVPGPEAALSISLLPEEITSPSMTAEWENRLSRVADGREDADAFLDDITAYVRDVVARNNTPADDATRAKLRKTGDRKVIGKCPRCGSDVAENRAGWGCVNRDCKFMLFADSKFFQYKKKKFTERIARELVTKGKSLVKGMYSERTDTKYDAYVVLQDDGEGYVRFGLEFPPKDGSKGAKKTSSRRKT